MSHLSKAFADLMKLMETFKVPGTDVSATVESARKDMEALIEANKASYHGPQALTLKQRKMLTEAMQKIQKDAKYVVAPSLRPWRRKMARDAYHKVLGDMKKLADIARKSQAQAMTQVADRAIERLHELKKRIQPK
jgi:hypothetical protein